MMNIGTGARMLRDYNVDKKTYYKVKKMLYDILEKKIFHNNNYYKANIFLVSASK